MIESTGMVWACAKRYISALVKRRDRKLAYRVRRTKKRLKQTWVEVIKKRTWKRLNLTMEMALSRLNAIMENKDSYSWPQHFYNKKFIDVDVTDISRKLTY